MTFFVWICRIWVLPFSLGKPISIWTSSLPGLSRASSIMSLLRCFVCDVSFPPSKTSLVCCRLIHHHYIDVTRSAPIGHSDDKDIVELVDPVNLGEKLVHNGVIHPRALSPARPSSFADCVDLVKDDDVQPCISSIGSLKEIST